MQVRHETLFVLLGRAIYTSLLASVCFYCARARSSHTLTGSGVIHLIGGVASLVGVKVMGFRNQFLDSETRRTRGNPPELVPRYERDELGEWKMNALHQHSPVLASTGVFLLAFGWIGIYSFLFLAHRVL